MSITITGPDWPSVRALRAALADVPATGTYALGRKKLDAITQLTTLRDVGVPVPEFTTDWTVASAWVADQALVFGRKLRHSHGSDIVGPTHRRWSRSEWWSKVITDVTAEWRIHVLHDRVIARGLKVQTGTARPYHAALPVRSRADGWTMVHNIDPPRGIRTLAKRAVSALHYPHGAVDILVRADGTFVVLEVNLIPGMDNYTVTQYAKAIQKEFATT